MRLITVYANEVAFIKKRGKLIDVLTEGRYWIGFNKAVQRHLISGPIIVDDRWTVYLQNEKLADLMEVHEIADFEIGLEMKEGLFTRVLKPGKVAYWKEPIKYEVQKVNLKDPVVSSDVPAYILKKPAVLAYLRVFPVEVSQKAMLFIDGEFNKVLGPGVYSYWRTDQLVSMKIIDTRVQAMEIAGQEILTKDKAGVRVSFSGTFKVIDMEKALLEAKDFQVQLYTAFQLVLRSYIGGMTLDQLLANKELIGPYVLETTAQTAESLGVEVLSGGIKDVILPGDVKDIMNQVLLAQKRAQANTITRQEETASTRSLLNTAKLMEDNSMLLKLKEMEYMEKIADKIGEITVNGGSKVMDQLGELMLAK